MYAVTAGVTRIRARPWHTESAGSRVGLANVYDSEDVLGRRVYLWVERKMLVEAQAECHGRVVFLIYALV